MNCPCGGLVPLGTAPEPGEMVLLLCPICDNEFTVTTLAPEARDARHESLPGRRPAESE